MDFFHTGNLITYLGKQANVDDMTVSPVILRKGKLHSKRVKMKTTLETREVINYTRNIGCIVHPKRVKINSTLGTSETDLGKSKLALYGMGYVKDERLHRTFQNGKVCHSCSLRV